MMEEIGKINLQTLNGTSNPPLEFTMENFINIIEMSNSELREKIINQGIYSDSTSISETILCIDGEATKIRRVFCNKIKLIPSDIGWILFNDVKKCMVCIDTFSFNLSKYHCHACGNVICARCCQFDAVIEGNKAGCVACHQCFWGQSSVPINPTFDDGFPVHINDLDLFGEVRKVQVESRLVIRGKSLESLSIVYINICLSDLIPQHTENGVIYMLYGVNFVTEDNVKVYHVVVNPGELLNRLRNYAKDFNDIQTVEEDGGVVELCTQAMDFVSRASCDPLCTPFKIESALPFYNYKLSIGDNERYRRSLSAKKKSSKEIKIKSLKSSSSDSRVFGGGLEVESENSHMVSVYIPDESCFRKFIQVPLREYQGQEILISAGKKSTNLETRSYETLPASFRKFSVGTLKHSEMIDKTYSNTPETLIFDVDDVNFSGTLPSSRLSKTNDEGEDNNNELLATNSRVDEAESVCSSLSDTVQHFGSALRQKRMKKIAQGLRSVNPKMLKCEEMQIIEKSFADRLKADSLATPVVLVGWLILIVDEQLGLNGNFVISDVHKSFLTFRKTKFKVHNLECSKWVLLSRGIGKSGCHFEILRDVCLN